MKLQVVEVEKLNPELLEKLVNLEAEAFGEGGLNEWTLPIMVRCGKVFALKKDDETCGLAEVVRDWGDSDEVFLVGFFVKESYREKGFGKYFLGTILERLKKDRVKRSFLTVSPTNSAALSLYEQFGFKEVTLSKDEYGRGEDRVIMKLDLGA